MKPNIHPHLFAIVFASLLTIVTARGALVTVTYRVPLPVAANDFVFQQYDATNTSIVVREVTYLGIVTPNTSGGSPIYDDAAYLELTAQLDLAGGSWFWLHDRFVDSDIQYQTTPASPPPPVVISLSSYSKFFFAADVSRMPDDFSLLLDGSDRVLVPVTKRPQVQLPITSGGNTVLTTFPFFTAYCDPTSVWGYWSVDAYLLDVTESHVAGANIRAVPVNGWSPLSGSIATRSMTFILADAESGNGFTIHSGASLTGVTPAQGDVSSPLPPYYYYNVRFVGGTVGTLDTVWLTRNADLASSPHAVGQGPVVDYRNAFQALPPREMHTLRLRLRADTRGGHLLTILHGDGFPEPLAFKSTSDTLTQTTTANVSTSVNFYWAETEFDNTRAWSLVDESTNPVSVLFSSGPGYFQQIEKRSRPLDVLDGWEPPRLATAAGSRRFTLSALRRTHTLRLVPPAGGAAINLAAATNDSSASYEGPWDDAVQVAAFEATASGASPGTAYTLNDETSGDSIALAPGIYTDLTMWRPPAPSLSLRIADTRWPDGLILRQADGSEYRIAPENVQGTWVPTIGGNSTYTFYSFGYFDGTTRYDSGNDWWAVDLTALASGSPNSASPHQTTDLHAWGASNQDSDNDGVTNYNEFVRGTLVFNPDTDGDGYLDGVDAFPLDPRYHAAGPNVPNAPPTIVLTSPRDAVLTN